MLVRQIANDLAKKIRASRDQQFTGVINIGAPKVGETHPALNQRSHPWSNPWSNQWSIYLVSGQLVWIENKAHALRRWKRHLGVYSSALLKQATQGGTLPSETWNYGALARLVKLRQIPEKQISNVAESVVSENLFDIFQATAQPSASGQFTCRQMALTPTGTAAITINQDRAWREATHEWDEWVRAGLSDYSPNLGLAINQPEGLRLRTTPPMFQSLKVCCDRNHSLRDLAIRFRQPVAIFTQSMLPYIDEDLVAFSAVSNLTDSFEEGAFSELFVSEKLDQSNRSEPADIEATNSFKAASSEAASSEAASSEAASSETDSPQVGKRDRAHAAGAFNVFQEKETADTQSIVYIDDSPLDSQLMARIVKGLKYKYLNISDPIQALPALLEIKPALIFLDLVMPTANGYEVCAQIRRISAFKLTPVIIVTSNDGVADRVRAKLVGASGFLGKPIRPSKVAKVLAKYLPSSAFSRLADQTAEQAADQTTEQAAEKRTHKPIVLPVRSKPSPEKQFEKHKKHISDADYPTPIPAFSPASSPTVPTVPAAIEQIIPSS